MHEAKQLKHSLFCACARCFVYVCHMFYGLVIYVSRISNDMNIQAHFSPIIIQKLEVSSLPCLPLQFPAPYLICVNCPSQNSNWLSFVLMTEALPAYTGGSSLHNRAPASDVSSVILCGKLPLKCIGVPHIFC